jgi:hypothetical protein
MVVVDDMMMRIEEMMMEMEEDYAWTDADL